MQTETPNKKPWLRKTLLHYKTLTQKKTYITNPVCVYSFNAKKNGCQTATHLQMREKTDSEKNSFIIKPDSGKPIHYKTWPRKKLIHYKIWLRKNRVRAHRHTGHSMKSCSNACSVSTTHLGCSLDGSSCRGAEPLSATTSVAQPKTHALVPRSQPLTAQHIWRKQTTSHSQNEFDFLM